ncbi:MAG: hypothetical protein KAS32_28555 [Candidatus Peribacteraceae bacterium]|nr:hypothetical protein [Candidatus Peribacteraceae bacterium]
MSRIIIYPYKIGSNSASVLAEALREMGHRCFKVFPDRNFRPRSGDFYINWGNSITPNWTGLFTTRGLNDPNLVGHASNKLTAFERMQADSVQVPEFTSSENEATTWHEGGGKVVSRHKLQGHSGVGIVLSTNEGISVLQRGVQCPLYVKYIKKSAEYRVHVFNGEVIDIQQKRRRRETPDEDVNYQVRSHANGWVFTREDVNPDTQVRAQAVLACTSLGLDFGAVDIIWNEHYQRAYVLEVNTAPGLEGSTIASYAEAIHNIVNSR